MQLEVKKQNSCNWVNELNPSRMKDKIKILITDDHPIIRRGLAAVINSDSNLEVVGEAENGEIALQKIESLDPDVVLLDIDMPVLDGIETAKIINATYPNVKIVFLSMHKDKEILKPISSLKTMGYVLKDSAVIEIVDCLIDITAGKRYFSPEIREILIGFFENEQNESDSQLSVLSPTELKIMRRLSEAKSNREISKELFVSIRTVENHRFNICQKLGIRGNHSLLKFAFENKDEIFSKNKELEK